MSPQRMLVSCVLTVVMLAVPAVAASDRDNERSDRVVFNRLLNRLNQVEHEYARAVEDAMAEARQSEDGEVSLTTKSKLISLRDRRDRIVNRLTVISLRWGWDLPDADYSSEARPQMAVAEWERLFEPADRIVRGRFVDQSREIARRVVMPVISLPPLGGGGDGA